MTIECVKRAKKKKKRKIEHLNTDTWQKVTSSWMVFSSGLERNNPGKPLATFQINEHLLGASIQVLHYSKTTSFSFEMPMWQDNR